MEMTAGFRTATRSAALAAALLFTAGSMAAPAFAQATGGAAGGTTGGAAGAATGGAPSPGPGTGEGLTGPTYQGQVGETQATPSDRDAARASDAASDRMTGAREPQPGETQGATVSVDLLWPECGDVRGQPARMVECLNLQQLEEVARLSDQSRRQ